MHYLRFLSLFPFIAMAVVVPALAADNRPLPRNAKLYIAEMDKDLDGFIRAELTKERIPVLVTLDESAAEIVMIGSSADKKSKWHEGWLSTKGDTAQGNISIIDPKQKVVLWSSEAGDRSMWKGAWSRGGERKVAERLVNNLKKAIQKE